MANKYIYAVRNTETGKLVSKSNANAFYSRKGFAEEKCRFLRKYRGEHFEVVTFKITEEGLENDLELTVYVDNDEYEGERGHSIVNKENDITFGVSNLYECPEDACIGRDLFDAGDYIRALNKGIELAQKGYTSVSGNFIENDEE